MIKKTIAHPGWEETHVTIAGPVEPGAVARAVGLLPQGAQIVLADVFGTREEIAAMEHCLRQAGVTAPPTCVVSSVRGYGGLQFVAASGCKVTPLASGGTVVGFLLDAEDARQLYLGGVTASDVGESREAQAVVVFARMEGALGMAGLDFSHVARTWFYNDRILEWYPQFNAVRTDYFQRHKIRQMPASTGIGAPNPAGAALVAKTIAVAPRRPGSASVEVVRSPLQGEAFAYGSAFSRAVMIQDACSRTLHVSGTASIDPDGNSVHQGDCAAQIDLTMRVVTALIGEAGMTFGDTTRAVVYLRDPADFPLWEALCRAQGLENFPAVAVGCDICRDDLLFEIEVELADNRL